MYILFIKDLQRADFNRSWTGIAYGSGYEGQGCVNDEMANYYVEFMKTYLCILESASITSKVLPMLGVWDTMSMIKAYLKLEA